MSDMDTNTLKQMAGMAGMVPKRRGDRVFDFDPTPTTKASSHNSGGQVESRVDPTAGPQGAGSMVGPSEEIVLGFESYLSVQTFDQK